jgi:hypothetical protein
LVAQVEMGIKPKVMMKKKTQQQKTKKRGLKTAFPHLTCASQEFHTQF